MGNWAEYRAMVIDNLQRLEKNNQALEIHLKHLGEEISTLKSSIAEVRTSFRVGVLLISVLVSGAVSLLGMFYR